MCASLLVLYRRHNNYRIWKEAENLNIIHLSGYLNLQSSSSPPLEVGPMYTTGSVSFLLIMVA